MRSNLTGWRWATQEPEGGNSGAPEKCLQVFSQAQSRRFRHTLNTRRMTRLQSLRHWFHSGGPVKRFRLHCIMQSGWFPTGIRPVSKVRSGIRGTSFSQLRVTIIADIVS